MNSDSIVKAVLTTLDPNVNNLERTKSYKMIEEYKTNVFHLNDLPVLCGSNQHPSVILFGLQCLEHRIKRSWNQITVEMKGTIKESLFQLALNLQNMIPVSAERKVVSSVLAHLFVYLIKCEWPQHWPSMLDEFFTLGRKGQTQAKLTLNTFLRLYEDVMQFQDVPQPRRRDIISTLNDNLLLLFSFAFEIILDQLRILESQANNPQCAISLCREALAMLSGYLDSCRMDVLSQWKPHGVTEKYAAPELPFIRLLVNLIWLEGTRIEALDLLLLLLKRKQQGSDDSNSKLAEVLFTDPMSVNKILMVLCVCAATIKQIMSILQAFNLLVII
ncbi:hypothetical protein PHET_01666 [Paragonimus heterotremus]|uniref:Exportin-1/Importin-beta-like domain-containing protein n=1 Tax=Paragonimus heterotremus TaxID=100268 RepID=A0A8J4X2Z7_9TREM|nr:hypothetical protein PHET_01666 [Paragonimus heterotremus]